MSRRVFLLGGVASYALVQAPLGAAQETPSEVISAYHDGQAIRFLPRQSVDWASLAPADLRLLTIPTADESVIDRYGPLIDAYGGAEIASPTPVPEDLIGRRHYLVSPSGIGPILLDSTRVVTRLTFNATQTRLVARQTYGEMWGSPTDPIEDPEGGFVLSSLSELQFVTEPADFTADDLLLGNQAVQQTDDGYFGRGTAFWNIVAQYRFTIGESDTEWLFVQWAPDRELFEIGCEYRYSLFRWVGVGEPPVREAWTSYGCDV